MSPSVLAAYEEGKALVDQKKPAEGAALWTKLMEREEVSSERSLICWLRLRTGIAWQWAQQWDRAHAEYRLASAEAQSPIAKAFVLETIAKTYRAQQLFEETQASFLQAIEVWRTAYGVGLGVARLNFMLGAVASYHQRTDLEELYLGRAATLQEKLAPGSFDLGLTLYFQAQTAKDRNQLKTADNLTRKALAIWNMTSPGSLYIAAVQDTLAGIAERRGNYAERRRLLLKGLEIREKLAPESQDMASSLQNLGALETEAGDLDKAASYLERALAIEKLGREDLGFASLLSGLANLAGKRGDPALEDAYRHRALALRQRLAPGSLSVAASFLSLSESARNRGDLALAWEYGMESLHIYQKIVPGSLDAANILNDLAGIAEARHDLDLARLYCGESLDIISRLAPRGADMPTALTNLANLEMQMGELDSAQSHLERALDLWQQQDAKIMRATSTLAGLGEIAMRRGQIDLSQRRYKEALRLQERAAPESLDVLSILRDLGQAYAARDDQRGALQYFERALGLAQRLAPGSLQEAEIRHSIGMVQHRKSHPKEALRSLYSAAQALEEQVGRLGGAQDVQAGFGARHEQIYRDLLDLLIEQGKTEEAVVVLERSRARSFLSEIERRDLNWPLDLPPAQEKERRRLRAVYDSTQAEVARLDPKKDKKRLESLNSRLHELRQSYGAVTASLLEASPSFADLHKPKILDLAQMRQALDPGTLALLFDVSAERVHLFALSAGAPLRHVTLPLREADLRHDIETLLSVEGKQPTSPAQTALHEPILAEVSARLYDALLGPIDDLVHESSRLLIVPDGPLHLLPWSALAVPVPGQGTRHFLIQDKPYHVSLSVTVYDQLRKLRSGREYKGEGATLAAFGDPHFPFGPEHAPPTDVEPRIRSASSHGFRFESLPASRREVEQVATLFPRSTNVFLGSEATEEHAKALPKSTRIIHFATHAILDEHSPLDSAVVLSIPEKFEEGHDNGLLQAWEIFEQVRLDADLVVLSACESGLGKEMGGEGLIGLTRAFQYAGARSVMASLWKISDRTTAELMVRFYKHLKDGMPKDEALRAAQMELIQGPIRVKNEKGEEEEIDASAPYYWAAFQIYGDWQ
jgi:CHAT domain-containing protein/Tfp pilus assembly protein PilF